MLDSGGGVGEELLVLNGDPEDETPQGGLVSVSTCVRPGALLSHLVKPLHEIRFDEGLGGQVADAQRDMHEFAVEIVAGAMALCRPPWLS